MRRLLLIGALVALTAGPARADIALPTWQQFQVERAVRLGGEALLRGMAGHAEELSADAVRLDPEAPDAWRLRCAVLADAARWPDAAEAARRLTALVPDDVDAALVTGRIRVELADPAGAREAYARASELAPEDPRGPIGQALVAARLERDFAVMEASLRDALAREARLDLSALPLEQAWRPVADEAGFLAALQSVLAGE